MAERVELSLCGCGGTAMWNPTERKTGDYVDDLGFVDCTNCGLRTSGRKSREIAAREWNHGWKRGAEREREACANIALAIDSGRGNEKQIAAAIRQRS